MRELEQSTQANTESALDFESKQLNKVSKNVYLASVSQGYALFDILPKNIPLTADEKLLFILFVAKPT